SGRWMESVKSISGVVMLIVAFTFALPHLPEIFPRVRAVARLGLSPALLALGAVAGALQLRASGSAGMMRARKTAAILVSTAAGLSLVAYLSALPGGAQLEWREDFAAARAEAEADGRPYLIDFGADWCAA